MKFSLLKRHLIEFACFFMSGTKRAQFLKKRKVFHLIGRGCSYQPRTIPSEPYLVSLGNNVVIAANVTFITHDVCQTLFKNAGLPTNQSCLFYMNKIVIGNNVMVGSNSIILYGVTIGDNCIIGAGSVVTKDIPSGMIACGNPAKIVGSFNELASKRFQETQNRPTNFNKKEDIDRFFWNI